VSRTDVTSDEPVLAPPRAPGRSRGAYVIAALAVFWFLFGAAGGSFQGKLAEVQKNDRAAYLPNSAESTKVDAEVRKFLPSETVPSFLVYQRKSGLTSADRAKIAEEARILHFVGGVAGEQVTTPEFSNDGTVANIIVPLITKRGELNAHGKTVTISVNGKTLSAVEKRVLETAHTDAPGGLTVYSAGPGGLLVALVDSFNGVDGPLLAAAGLVVILILLVVYRSPVLWFFPLLGATLALGAAALIIYPLAKHGVLTLSGDSQGILSVLIIGAGTDYALLLISRYREELHNCDSRVAAMTKAWRRAAPAIAASAATVIIALLCLTLSQLNSDRSLGPVCAIGIACTVGVMLTFLPAFLVLFGRWIFWPRVPHVDNRADIASHGMWGRFAGAIGRHPRRSWATGMVVLLACVAAIGGLKTDGLVVTDSFTSNPQAVQGQQVFDRNFAQGLGAPVTITASARESDALLKAVAAVPGIQGSVCIAPDFLTIGALTGAGYKIPSQRLKCAPPLLQVQPLNGRLLFTTHLADSYDSPQAIHTVRAIRAAVHAIPAANALVGGSTAVSFDTQQASRHDRNLIIPIVLLVILIVLGLLLRAVLAPLLLIATVVLSFAAALGVSALVFNHVFHFANADPAFPLFTFVFLVALGIDYNIFLMTRVREESLRYGTRAGIQRGLALTGGVITSAGLVLAATFTVLGVLPIVVLAEIGFAVAFGVLLDTFLVRSVIVPALSLDLGRRIWWPSKLASGAE